MTTQVYYRKWRPQRMADLVGQEPVVRILRQAIALQRIAHAYLFCGPRGTGKTSTARILAKAVNCLAREDGEPCNACHLCVAVNEGRALDLVEIDAASNRGIDEIRSIREKVNYAPAEGTYKVYVLDEAHMLTDAAADALLKTLEEPPAHIIFILATTEPHKLPSTIISRCQRFDFRRISPEAMIERLAQICAADGIKAEPAALNVLTRNAEGSLRDAENFLEQAVTSFGSPLGVEQVRLLLGLTADERVRALVGHILRGEAPRALATLSAIAAEGLDLRQLHRRMVDELRETILIKSGAREMVSQPDEVVEEQAAMVFQVPMKRLLDTVRLLGHLTFRQDVPATMLLELAIVELAHGEAPPDLEKYAGKAPGADVPTPEPMSSSGPAALRNTGSKDTLTNPQVESSKPMPEAPSKAQTDVPDDSPNRSPIQTDTAQKNTSDDSGAAARLEREWDAIIKTLSRIKGRRFNIGALLRACRGRQFDGDKLFLEFTHRSHMDRMREEMDDPESRRAFMEVVCTAAGITPPLNLVFAVSNGDGGNNEVSQSPLLQAALGMGGRILEENNGSHE